MKKQKGITLIALVITIIVLLLLAGITIVALTGDNGILQKAGEVKNKKTDEEIEEQIKLAYQDYYLGQYTDSGNTFKDALDNMFGKGVVATVTESDGSYIIKFTDGKEYLYNVTNETIEKIAKWNDNGDESWTYSKTGTNIKIGDIVNYNEGTGYSYTTDLNKGTAGEYNAMSNTYKSKTYTTENLTWRLLNINKEGQIELISENPISQYMFIILENGYVYGPDELDKMCNTLYGNGSGAKSARSLKTEDIDKLAGVTTDEDKKALDNDYGTKWKYRYPTAAEVSGDRFLQYNKDSGEGFSDIWTDIGLKWYNNYNKFRMPGTNINSELNSTNPGTSSEIIYNIYFYNVASKVKQTAIDGLSISELLTKRYYIRYNWSMAIYKIN